MGAGASVDLEDESQKKLYEEMKDVYDNECKNGMVRCFYCKYILSPPSINILFLHVYI